MTRSAIRAAFAALITVTTGSLAQEAQSAAERPIAIVDVSVIPMDRDEMLRGHTVIIRGELVADVGPAARIRIPDGATVIDGRGKYLIPGLGDAHAHLSTVGGGTALAERAVQLFALHGVTMIRSMYTEPHHRAVKERVDRGALVGPRIVLASPAFTGHTAPTPALARDSLRKYHDQGYRIAKILPGISEATFDTLVVESKRLGMAVAGHVPPGIPLEHALGAGISSIEHLDGYLEAMNAGVGGRGSGFFGLGVMDGADASRIPRLAQATRSAGATVVPTEFEMEMFVSTDSGAAHARRPEMRLVPPALLEQWTRQKDNFARNAAITPERSARYRTLRRALIRELHAAGVPIALGSDAFNLFNVPGPGVVDELATYVAAGLTPQQALRTATVTVAGLLGIPAVSGTVKVGSVADLVLLEANPLDDIDNLRRQHGVVLRGRWYDRAELDRRLRDLVFPGPG